MASSESRTTRSSGLEPLHRTAERCCTRREQVTHAPRLTRRATDIRPHLVARQPARPLRSRAVFADKTMSKYYAGEQRARELAFRNHADGLAQSTRAESRASMATGRRRKRRRTSTPTTPTNPSPIARARPNSSSTVRQRARTATRSARGRPTRASRTLRTLRRPSSTSSRSRTRAMLAMRLRRPATLSTKP